MVDYSGVCVPHLFLRYASQLFRCVVVRSVGTMMISPMSSKNPNASAAVRPIVSGKDALDVLATKSDVLPFVVLTSFTRMLHRLAAVPFAMSPRIVTNAKAFGAKVPLTLLSHVGLEDIPRATKTRAELLNPSPVLSSSPKEKPTFVDPNPHVSIKVSKAFGSALVPNLATTNM